MNRDFVLKLAGVFFFLHLLYAWAAAGAPPFMAGLFAVTLAVSAVLRTPFPRWIQVVFVLGVLTFLLPILLWE